MVLKDTNKKEEVSPLTHNEQLKDSGIGGVSPLTHNNYLDEYQTEENFGTSLVNKQQSKPRSYKCPSCEGEFDEWHKKYKDRHGGWVKKESLLRSASSSPVRKFCPFCDLERGEYDNE
jgi:hypothetical protein